MIIISAGVVAGAAGGQPPSGVDKVEKPANRASKMPAARKTSNDECRMSNVEGPLDIRHSSFTALVRAELPRQLHELDSPSYEARCQAEHRLEKWVTLAEQGVQPELGDVLADEFQRRMLQPDLPLEARWRIELWRSRLPKASIAPPPTPALPELQRLVAQLDDKSFAVRAGATERLQWLASNGQYAAPILMLLKRRLVEPGLNEDSYRRLEEVRRIAWGMWLDSEETPTKWVGDGSLPPASPAQIEQWLDDLSRPGSRGDSRSPLLRRIARQNLMDALANDADLPRVTAALEARLRGKLEANAGPASGCPAVRELLALTRPVIVAEVWSEKKLQEPEQRMIIGEPRVFAAGANPSCFDRADDRSAHCASGNSLLPGNYPVGIAFPAPRWKSDQEGFFYLVNLPTPRRQIAYSYYLQIDPAVRLAKLSRRTLDRFLAEKRPLNDPELGMLGQLDAREVSAFAARYFFVIDDDKVDEASVSNGMGGHSEYSTSRKHLGGDSSRFGSICAQLAIDGTREAIPGLLDAIRQKRILPPKSAPYRFEWLAAFSIARRDPWPGVDAWLAENLDNREELDVSHSDAAEIGATAAAILLDRHREKPADYGLQLVVDPHLLNYKVVGYSYAAADPLPSGGEPRGRPGVSRVRKWWMQQVENAEKPVAAR